MTIEELQKEAEALSFTQQGELEAYVVQLRNRRDSDYMAEMQCRIEDADRSHWLTPDEFERRLDAE